MASYASGSIRVPGLSGNDTDFVDMIKKLKEIESKHVTQLTQWKKDWQTRLNAFKELRGELMNLQTSLNSLNSMDKFLVKSTVSSDDKVATAVADADSSNSSYSITVNQLASNCTWTKKLPVYEKTESMINDESVNDGKGSITYTYKGTTRTVNIPKGTTAEGFVKLINNDSKNPGVKAQLIQTADGLTFQLRGMDTGKSNYLVINETNNIKGLEVNLEHTSYEDNHNSFKLIDGFTDENVLINETGSDKTFVYTIDGTRRTVTVGDGWTIKQLTEAINKQMEPADKVAFLKDVTGGVQFSIEKPNTTHSLQGASGSQFNDLMDNTWGNDTDKVVTSGSGYTLNFEMTSSDGSAAKPYSIEVDDEMTVRDLMNAIKSKVGQNASVELGADNKIKVTIPDTEHRVTVEDGTLEGLSYKPPVDKNWDVKAAANAQVRINGYPSEESGTWIETTTNTLKSGEVMPGITFNLHSKGDAEISVSTDTEKITENIQTFVDAVNSFRTKLMELTQYDENKEVLDPEYAESQFEMQKGGILQGNYGVQMVASRLKSAISGSALGFSKRILDTDGSVLSGDLFTTLSQIGITTNATNGEANYGLLEINYIAGKGGSKSLTEALEEDPEAVAKLFASANTGETHSENFFYDSHVSGITQPGTYNVSYEIDAQGKIIESSIFINGQQGSYDPDTNLITAVGDNNPAKGLALQVVDFTPGKVVKNDTVSIKTGKIQETLGLLEGSEGILGTNGTLRNLERNYQTIIDGIDDKIQKEDDRLQRWESNMVLKFARLEQVLASYSQQQAQLESSLAQLGGSSK